MTPQLQQAIKLLQLNNMELAEFVESELAQNPLLEKDDRDEREADDQSAKQETSDDMDKAFESVWTGGEEGKEPVGSAAASDFDGGSSMATVGAGGNRNFDDAEQSFENRMSRPETLREHLLEELHVSFDDPRDRMVGALMIDMLDESGYLRIYEDKTLSDRLGCSPDRLERLLKEMKQFDPTGVFAGDLRECLSLQLDEQGKLDTPMRALLDHLDLLARHEHTQLQEQCGVNETYLQDMIEELRALNPKPASKFDHFVVQTVVPDVLMKRLPKDLGGGWRVELNSETLPKVLVNQHYYTEVAKQARDKKDKAYLEQQLTSANWLVKAMDQRAKTILKVAAELIERQDAFFLYGIEYLRPLTLKDIAEKIDMHESTVSRVTNGKYIGTPRGIFELKYFFSTALSGRDGETYSAESIRARIKMMVEQEEPKKVLSDDAIVDLLGKEGVKVARRTVAKYRESMNIPSSVQRRRMKKH